MLEKHIVWLKLWDNIKSLATINGKIPISLFILQNTKNMIYNYDIINDEINKEEIIIKKKNPANDGIASARFLFMLTV